MRHNYIKKQLVNYLDEALPENEMQAVRQHLAHCQTCRDDLHALARLWRPEQPAARLTAPPNLWRRIAARLPQEKTPGIFEKISQSFFPVLRPVFIGAGLIVILLGGVELGQRLTLPVGPAEAPGGNATENFGLNYFEVLPPGSIDDRWLVLTESELQP